MTGFNRYGKPNDQKRWWLVKGHYRNRAGISRGEWSRVVEAHGELAAEIDAQRSEQQATLGGQWTAVVSSVRITTPASTGGRRAS